VRVVRRLGALAATVLAAVAVGHVFLVAASGERVTAAVAGTPRFLVDVVVHRDLGATPGRACDQILEYDQMCVNYPPSTIAAMLGQRLPADIALLLGGLAVGVLGGVAGGRWCATRPRTRSTRALHAATALQLSFPVFAQALIAVIFFSSNVSGFVRLPFLSGQGDYVPLSDDPLRFVQALWVPWLLAGLPLAAFVLRVTEALLREGLREGFIRTARAKGLAERRVVNRHALPLAAPAVTATVGVNASLMLVNIAVIEYIYGIPGMFRALGSAFRLPVDVPVLQALVLEAIVLVVVLNFLADAVLRRLDPRVRWG
jgi:peptide/nickel transport system permease protein